MTKEWNRQDENTNKYCWFIIESALCVWGEISWQSKGSACVFLCLWFTTWPSIPLINRMFNTAEHCLSVTKLSLASVCFWRFITSPPGGGCEVLFSPCLSVCLSVCRLSSVVCLSVCLSVCLWPIFWYFISRLLDTYMHYTSYYGLKYAPKMLLWKLGAIYLVMLAWPPYYTCRVVLNSLKQNYLYRLKVKVTGTIHCFLKVQSYHKNWDIENFQSFL